MINRIKLYINTIKYLKPSQIYYRLIKRTKRILYNKGLLKIKTTKISYVNDINNYLIEGLDYDDIYLSRFKLEDVLNDEFTFINIKNKVELSEAWNNHDVQHLWRFNLHYFEYIYILADEYSNNNNNQKYYAKFRYFIESWISNNPFGNGDGWHPYTISLRITNWISVYPVFKDKIEEDIIFRNEMIDSIYLQYQYLLKNLEKDILGNHYFENIKAVIIGSIFFDEKEVTSRFKKKLLKQLKEQILKDGMHFELSPMYHKIILEDLIKVAYWLKRDSICKQLRVYIQKMINVTYSFEDNFGKTPAFNDSANGVSKDYKLLIKMCKNYFDITPEFKSDLQSSGYYIITGENKKLIFDTGDISPSYLPGHGHCDALSFELSINNKPFIVNSGTFRYEEGKWRDYFRSTKAHNTVVIEDYEQSQVWKSFRVASRIKNVKRKKNHYKNIPFYSGSYISFMGHEHKRLIGYIDENLILILDYVGENLDAKSYLHFAPKVKLEIEKKLVKTNHDDFKVIPIGADNVKLEQSWYSEEFNKKNINNCVIFEKENKCTYFGYLISLSSDSYEILELSEGITIKNNKNFEVFINYEALGEIL